MFAMTGINVIPAFSLAVSATLLAAAPSRQAPQGQRQDQTPRMQIIVDQSCRVQPESDAAVMGNHGAAFRDGAICHLESVLSSHHIEEKIDEGQSTRALVRIAEREYVMQNVTDRPAVFIVHQTVPENWTVDSDPQPYSMDGSQAEFQVNAEPGQIVRLHVGLRNSTAIQPAE